MKKSVFIIGLLLFSLFINLASADLGNQVEQTGEKLEQIGEKVEEIKEQTETKWDYLGKEWRKILLENNFISALDSFFTKISIVFRILFGQSYSLSVTLLVVILLWLYFFLSIYSLVKGFSAFQESTSILISLFLTIILANIGFFLGLTKILGWLIFVEKGWIWNIIVILFIILFFLILYRLKDKLIYYSKQGKEKMKKAQEEAKKIEEEADKRALRKIFRKVADK